MPDRPNIVLVCVDQWRGDCLGIDGHPVVQTPYLDELAVSGVRFQRAYSATPTCIAARAALFTGLGQRSHGRVGYRDGVDWNYPVTLAGEFTRHGYQTQAVGKMHVYPERSQVGFQNVILHDGYLHFARRHTRDYTQVDDYIPWLRQRLGGEGDYLDHGVNCNSVVARPWDKPEHLHPTNFVTGEAIDFLRRRDPRKPFFLFVSYHRPHPPYDPPAWAFQQYIDQPMPDPPKGDWLDLLAPYDLTGRADANVGDYSPAILQRARAGYYGHMSHIDQQVHRLVEMLREYDVWRSTYLCFTSDHGEMLGDHRMYRKGYGYEDSCRVPMVLVGPPGCSIAAKSTRQEVIELRDVMPTLLACAGLPIPTSVEGASFLPLARGEEAPWRHYVHGEHTIFDQSQHWLTDGREKYLWWSGSGREQFFDLREDPQECHDLARLPAHAQRIAHWRDALIAELAGREEGFIQDHQLVAGRPVRPCLSHILPQ